MTQKISVCAAPAAHRAESAIRQSPAGFRIKPPAPSRRQGITSDPDVMHVRLSGVSNAAAFHPRRPFRLALRVRLHAPSAWRPVAPAARSGAPDPPPSLTDRRRCAPDRPVSLPGPAWLAHIAPRPRLKAPAPLLSGPKYPIRPCHQRRRRSACPAAGVRLDPAATIQA